ncbi:hypothetical protein [Paenibacillus shirakamiensis]|uniref:hypothetical protein n=1 Tax=Paenibacillus shirakamiensis TaxID=1265935 RepID=UPI001AE854B4|nr:hypothetical protein [Paenibacillus shirakamiensis]
MTELWQKLGDILDTGRRYLVPLFLDKAASVKSHIGRVKSRNGEVDGKVGAVSVSYAEVQMPCSEKRPFRSEVMISTMEDESVWWIYIKRIQSINCERWGLQSSHYNKSVLRSFKD